ncbi:MAG: phosphomannomutase/phosphoglucomutase [Kangiellaceae bacterium]|nr:phosphomannomutase/phosphoglucomutase [Kangiellaceae bacterium]
MAKGKNIVSFFVPALLIGLAVLLAVSAALYLLGIQQPLEQQAKQLMGTRIAERARLVESKLDQIQQSVALASQAVANQSDATITTNIKQQINDIDQAVIFTEPQVQLNLEGQPVISHVTVDMLRKAFAGEKPTPELILKNNQAAYVAFVEPLSQGKVLLATVSPQHMQSLLGSAEQGTFMELRQNFDGSQHRVATAGQGAPQGNPLVESPSFGTNWSIAMWQTGETFLSKAGTLPILLLIGAVLALLIAGLMPYFSLQRILNQDARGFIQGVSKGHVPNNFKLSFFNDLAASYKRIQGQATHNDGLPETANSDSESLRTEPKSRAKANKKSQGNGKLEVDVMRVAENINPNMFREYDIRGEADRDLTAEAVFTIGKALGSEAYTRGEQKVIVGRDGRLSSPELQAALIQGLQASGRDVIDIGMVATPLVYFATNTLGTRSGIMLTGSHNPANHNGLKIVLAGETLYGRDIKNILQRIKDNDFLNGQGSVKQIDIEQSYLEKLVADISLEKPMKVVVDCGNGVTGALAPRLFQALGCEVIGLYTDVDGNFPNHHPDPNTSSNLKDLIRSVKSENADVGIAFDGDGDRLGVVDNQGKVIWTDRLMMLFAMDVLSRNSGADILYDVKCSRHLTDIIKQHGGVPVMWKTGHSLMKAKMREIGTLLGGEGSGHVYFKERWYGFDDAFYAAARLLELLAKDPRSAGEVFASLPESISSEEVNVPVPDNVKFKLIEALSNKGDFGQEANLNTIDGVRVEYEDKWMLARASNTTPSIVVKFEADDELALEHLKTILRDQLLAIAPKLKLNF